MKISRRQTLCGLSALGGLSLFNVGCAGFGQSRTAQLAAGGKIRIAIIGCGDWGRKLLNRAGSLGGCELVAISDPDPKAIADLYKMCGKVWSKEALAAAKVFPDYRELFDKVGDELDAVVSVHYSGCISAKCTLGKCRGFPWFAHFTEMRPRASRGFSTGSEE